MSVVKVDGVRVNLPRLSEPQGVRVRQFLADLAPGDTGELHQLIAFGMLVFVAHWRPGDALEAFESLAVSLPAEEPLPQVIGRCPDHFWESLRPWLNHPRPQLRQLRWRGLAMLTLREFCGYTMQDLGHVWSRHKGNMTRALTRLKAELRRQFALAEADVDPPVIPPEAGN